MDDFRELSKMYFILDGSGNFYYPDSSGQLMPARSKEEAGVFSYLEARQHTAGRKSRYYCAVPVEDSEGRAEHGYGEAAMPAAAAQGSAQDRKDKDSQDVQDTQDIQSPGRGAQEAEEIADLSEVDWESYLQDFCYITANLQAYRGELSRKLSHTEQEIQDLLHYIELYDLDEERQLEAAALLQDARTRRREAKDEMLRTEYFQSALGNSGNMAKAKGAVKQMRKLGTRIYHPKMLPELFEGVPMKRERKKEEHSSMEYREYEAYQEYRGYQGYQEYQREETPLDGRGTDWGEMARRQWEFFQNAEQYMRNLQIDLEDIDRETGDILHLIEDANYNVAQGYKVFKRLKELRILRKEKERELAAVQAITGCFSCRDMAEAYAVSYREIQEIMGAGPDEPDTGDTGTGREFPGKGQADGEGVRQALAKDSSEQAGRDCVIADFVVA